jgi:hypothetical protein
VRVLDDGMMRGAGLLRDFRAALRLNPEAVPASVANAASHWAILETLRALMPGESEIGWPAPMLAAIEALMPKLEACVAAHAAALAEPAYLTADQATRLGRLYEEDVAQIGAASRMPASAVAAPRVRQGPCPSWALLPAAFLRDAARAASADELTAPLGIVLTDLAARRCRVS